VRVLGYDNDPINQNLLLDIFMDEGAGLIAHDSAKPHHVDPTLVGTPTWTNVSGLSVLNFDRTHPDYVRILLANCADINFTTQPFTISCWIYSTSNTWNTDFIMFGNGGDRGYELGKWTTGGIYLKVCGGTYKVTSPISLNVWHFIALTRITTNAWGYVDGIQQTLESDVPVSITISAADLAIGGAGSGGGYGGWLGMLYRPRIWSRALAPREINELFQRERGLFGV